MTVSVSILDTVRLVDQWPLNAVPCAFLIMVGTMLDGIKKEREIFDRGGTNHSTPSLRKDLGA